MSWNTCTPSRTERLVAKGAPFPGGTDQVLRELLEILLTRGAEKTDYRLRDPGCWGYYCRDVAGTRFLSFHGRAGGRAVDVNAQTNGRGTRGDIPLGFVRLMERYGWTWGGRWSWTDPMHFEFGGSRAKARRMLARARREFGGEKARLVYRIGDRTFGQLDRALSFLKGKVKSRKGREAEYTLHVERDQR